MPPGDAPRSRAGLLHTLAQALLARLTEHPLRVAIDGVDASGKTTLADELAGCLRALTSAAGKSGNHGQHNDPCAVIRASIDGFHRPREVRYQRGPDSPDGYYADSFDLPALRRLLLDPLAPGGGSAGGIRSIQTRLYDYRSDAPAAAAPLQVGPDSLLLFDGVFLQRPELSTCWDVVLFVQVSFETVLARALQRDAEAMGGAAEVRRRYQARYIPAQQRYLADCTPAARADYVIRNDDVDHPQLLTHQQYSEWLHAEKRSQ